MKNLNKNKEWDFIKQEIVFNRPKTTPYKGKDLLKREFLFGLRELFCDYLREKSENAKKVRKDIYNTAKASYLAY